MDQSPTCGLWQGSEVMRIQEGAEALGGGVARPGSHRDLQRAWGLGQPTCLVGSAQFPDVVVVAGGEDLDQTGFVCASPLQRAQHTTGLLRPHWHPGKSRRCAMALLPRVQIQATEARAPVLLSLREPRHPLQPRAAPGDSDVVMRGPHGGPSPFHPLGT